MVPYNFRRVKKVVQQETGDRIAAEEKKMPQVAPIRFEDAVGRKFTFPYHLCQTWKVCGT